MISTLTHITHHVAASTAWLTSNPLLLGLLGAVIATVALALTALENRRVDQAAVRADDATLDQLGSATPGAAGDLADTELNALLLGWRHETETRPYGELVDTDTAITLIRGAAA